MKTPKRKPKTEPMKTWAHEPGASNRVATAAAAIYASGRAESLDDAARAATYLFKLCDLLLSQERDHWQVREAEFRKEFATLKSKSMTGAQAIAYIIGDNNAGRARAKFNEWRAQFPKNERDAPESPSRDAATKWLGWRINGADGHTTPLGAHLAMWTQFKIDLLLNVDAGRKLPELHIVASLRIEWLQRQAEIERATTARKKVKHP